MCTGTRQFTLPAGNDVTRVVEGTCWGVGTVLCWRLRRCGGTWCFDGVPVIGIASNLVDVRRGGEAADVVVTHLNMTCQAVGSAASSGKPVVHLCP